MEIKNYTAWMEGKPEQTGPEGYPIYANDPYRGLQEIINVYLAEIKQKNKTLFKSYINPEDYSTGQTLMNLPATHQTRLLLAIFIRLYWLKNNAVDDSKFAYFYITSSLFRRKQPFTLEELATIIDLCAECYSADEASIKGLIRQVEWFVKDNGLDATLVPPLRKLQAQFKDAATAEDRKIAERIEEIINE